MKRPLPPGLMSEKSAAPGWKGISIPIAWSDSFSDDSHSIDDADTTAAVCGQIAGAFYGVQAIPAEWMEKLSMRERIEELAEGLFARSGLPTFPEG